ncbi:hypothetical protein B0187_02200 [Haemophilus paracuniculus]|uniref:Uncharacterized protein n=1 Tax=Haemophilus paracuniculus TaxID=734 RepID=A0A1T0AUU0_9PAST|nr:hypothetical protein [Haemophilus paracuniculus]OOS00366.1 hypothetical protein B0187_02200 [Haemophilus paracuniculus]
MLNLFRSPIEKETLEDWGKLCLDVAKVAILAIPVMIYSKDPIAQKLFNISLLTLCAYGCLIVSRVIRLTTKKGD